MQDESPFSYNPDYSVSCWLESNGIKTYIRDEHTDKLNSIPRTVYFTTIYSLCGLLRSPHIKLSDEFMILAM